MESSLFTALALDKLSSSSSSGVARSRSGSSSFTAYSTSPRNGNPANGNHLEICLSFPQKNGNYLAIVSMNTNKLLLPPWVLVALPVCPTSPLRLKDSAESRAGEWEL